MKFWVKLNLNERDAGELIRSFFTDFNPENSIVIKGKEAKLEISFDQKPPMVLIKTISNCEVEEFHYGKVLGEYDGEDEQRISEEVYNKQEVISNKDVEQKEVRAKKVKPKKAKTKKEKAEIVQILKNLEFAKKVNSYEEFVQLVVNWLELGNSQKFFEAIINVAERMESINWNNIKEKLNEKGVPYRQFAYMKCNNQILAKFDDICDNKETKVTFLKLVEAIVSYKNYDFSNVSSDEKNDDNDVSIGKVRIKMECMPEIPEFEEMLGTLDKTQPIEKRTKYVLDYMGLENRTIEEQHKIVEVVNIAMQLRDINRDSVLANLSSAPDEFAIDKWMSLSMFINYFVYQYDKSKKVKVEDFLKDLKKVIIIDSEK